MKVALTDMVVGSKIKGATTNLILPLLASNTPKTALSTWTPAVPCSVWGWGCSTTHPIRALLRSESTRNGDAGKST